MYRKFIAKLNLLNELLLKVEKWICFADLFILFICLIWQVITRFILKTPATWTEEFARYTFIFGVFVSCGFTLHHNKHVDMNLIDTVVQRAKNPKKAFFIYKKVTMVANIAFSLYFSYLYYPYLMHVKATGRVATSYPLPLWLVMASVLVGMVLMAWHSFVILLQPYDESQSVK